MMSLPSRVAARLTRSRQEAPQRRAAPKPGPAAGKSVPLAGRRVVALGDDDTPLDLLVDKRLLRSNLGKVETRVAQYFAAAHVSWILRRLDITCVFDVGANLGQYAASLREHGYRGRIVSFEPVPQLAEQLRERARDDGDWRVYDVALGEEEGTAQMNAVPGAMSSLLTPSEFGRNWSANLTKVRPEMVTVRRLDSVYAEATAGIAEPRVYLKMDTQGYDVETFRGAGGCLDDVLALQSEVACVPIYDGMRRLPEMLAVYEDAGFEISGMYPVTIHRRSLRVIEFDMVMVRPETAEERR